MSRFLLCLTSFKTWKSESQSSWGLVSRVIRLTSPRNPSVYTLEIYLESVILDETSVRPEPDYSIIEGVLNTKDGFKKQ